MWIAFLAKVFVSSNFGKYELEAGVNFVGWVFLTHPEFERVCSQPISHFEELFRSTQVEPHSSSIGLSFTFPSFGSPFQLLGIGQAEVDLLPLHSWPRFFEAIGLQSTEKAE